MKRIFDCTVVLAALFLFGLPMLLVALRTERGVHRLIPGITGWAQINGRDDIPIPKKVEFDAYYLLHRSFLLDIKIILLTVFKVVRREGVVH